MSHEPFSVAVVATHFEQKTGLELHPTVEIGSSARIVILGARSLSTTSEGDIVATEDPALAHRFGQFDIVVYEDAEAAQALSSGSDDNTDSAILWREHPPEEQSEVRRSARKLYGNVQLIWFSEARATDERWTELDSVLTSLGRA